VLDPAGGTVPPRSFALRLALLELDKLHKNGMTQESFDRTREFLSKFVNVLTKSKRAELGLRDR